MIDQRTDLEAALARIDRLEGEVAALMQFNLGLCRMLREAAARHQDAPDGQTLLAIAQASEWAAARLGIPNQDVGQHNGFERVADLLNRARNDIPLPTTADSAPVREARYLFPEA